MSEQASKGRYRFGILLTMALVASLAGTPATALRDDERQPIVIEADHVEVLEAESTSIYLGHVQVDQGSMRLLGDQVTVYHREDRRPRLIIAIGKPASFKQQLDDDEARSRPLPTGWSMMPTRMS